jgi:hypothetical protein
MKSAGQVMQVVVVRGRGRPRLDTRRVECMVPREVYEQLIREEAATNVYRTRVAAHVLCEWAATRSGQQLYHS